MGELTRGYDRWCEFIDEMWELTRAYHRWSEFIDEMTALDGTDWQRLGSDPSFGFEQAETFWLMRDTDPHHIYERFYECIDALMFIENEGKNALPFRDRGGRRYNLVKTFPYLAFANQHTLAELRTLARLNLADLPNSDCKIVWVMAIEATRRLGFNSFAVKSPMNDDVLRQIKSFV